MLLLLDVMGGQPSTYGNKGCLKEKRRQLMLMMLGVMVCALGVIRLQQGLPEGETQAC